YSELTTPDKLTELKPSIVSMASNLHSLYIATDTEVFSINLATMQGVESVLQMKPSHYISRLNAKNDKLAVTFLTANNQNSIELYTKKSAE
ncbi:MAG TPA: hypothetical protein DCS78_00045, partial [Pseudoalteromonas shioyasakiensis]|nr:hypothetical protein [Pseudoalteromonas shioyasakiensis]